MAELSKLMILEESVIVNLAGNPNFVKEYPFLSGVLNALPAAKVGCGKCNRGANRRIQAINGVKQAFLNMGPEKKQKLKQLLNTEKVRIRVVVAGKVLEYTF